MKLIGVVKEFFKIWLCTFGTFKVNVDYKEYWDNRSSDSLNSFQESRLKIISSYICSNYVVSDIGCGQCVFLEKLVDQTGCIGKGFDVVRPRSLAANIEFFVLDLEVETWDDLISENSVVLLLEVLEHLKNPEQVLIKILGKTNREIFISVPNTGYLPYRLRLLLGRFPKQWRRSPGEHLRFWTMADLKDWLKVVVHDRSTEIIPYEGIFRYFPFWGALTSAGILVRIGEKAN